MDLQRTRVVSALPLLKHEELLALVRTNTGLMNQYGCALLKEMGGRFSVNEKGYVQIKVKTPYLKADNTNPNTKVQLHQLLAWNHPDETTRECFRAAIEAQELEISHLCNNKLCTNSDHLFPEKSFNNKKRWGCPVVIFINGLQHLCCKCEPRCVPTADKIETALHYNVWKLTYDVTNSDNNFCNHDDFVRVKPTIS